MQAVVLDKVSVLYRVPNEQIPTLKEYTIRWLKRRVGFQEFWALRGVSLAVEQGEVLGIVGRNGAGKSTLLKLVARVLKPTVGRVSIRGRVAPLLEITAGFDPELTGRENVYLNASILGLSKGEIDRRFDGIVEFAELADFINAPVRTYSTGMMARLGFAIATDADPDVLLVDEVLAVGDERFQVKCQDRIDRFRRNGVAIVIVGHSVEMIRTLCDRAAWLEMGELQDIGDGRSIAYEYQQFLASGMVKRERVEYFHPEWSVTRADWTRMVVVALGLPLRSPQHPTFADVQPGSPFYPYIEAAVKDGAFAGDGKGSFRAAEVVSRAEAVTIAVLLAQPKAAAPATSRFTDVDAGEWYARWLYAAEAAGFLPPAWESEFSPHNGLSRAEAAQIAVHLMAQPPSLPGRSSFVDVPMSAAFWPAVEIATAGGLVAGAPAPGGTGAASSPAPNPA
jgi:ABC-2 type transport system ATP-binding protein